MRTRRRSRDATHARSDARDPRRKREGAGKAGPRLRPVARLRKKCRRQEPQVQPDRPGLPCAMGERLLRALPGDRLVCSRHLRNPSGRQQAWRQHRGARTTRLERPRADSRLAQKRLTDPRPSLPASTYRDDAYAPLNEAGWREESISSDKTKVGNFCADIWTEVIALSALRNFRFRHRHDLDHERGCGAALLVAPEAESPDGHAPPSARA